MSEPFIAEIRMWACNFAPRGWAMCNGQILAISQNTALFSLIGTTYGGNGTSNFGLPNMQSSVPMGAGQGPGLTDRTLGEQGGEEAHTLLIGEMAGHSHPMMAFPAASNRTSPVGNTFGRVQGTTGPYTTGNPAQVQLAPLAVTFTGGNLPHENRMPYLAVNFCIALAGIFPSRN
jgi:microcystin-dependent protein